MLALVLALKWYVGTEAKWGYTFAVLTGVQAWFPMNWRLALAWNSPAWTLSVEALFYLLFPFMINGLSETSSRALKGILTTCLLYAIFCHSTELHPDPGWGEPITGMLPSAVMRVPEFVIGICLGLFFLRSTRRGYRGWQLGLACGSMLLLFLPLGSWVSVMVVPFAIILYQLAFGEGWLSAMLSTRVMLTLGGASYAIYMLQEPIREFVKELFAQFAPVSSADAIVSPFVLIGVSTMVFYLYEEPLRRAIRKFFARRTLLASTIPVKAAVP